MKALVVFDCDSTLVEVEGVDELATRAGVGERVAEMTRSAMEGKIPLEEVYGHRLDIIRPSRADLDWLGRRYIATLVTGARETVAALAAGAMQAESARKALEKISRDSHEIIIYRHYQLERINVGDIARKALYGFNN